MPNEVQTYVHANVLSIFLLQELLESIIDCLSQSFSDLRSCALVSRAWTTRAQSYLFWTVALTSEYNKSTGEHESARCLRGFEAYPHLARFVRHVIVSVNLHRLIPALSITFPSLREITIQSISSKPNNRVGEVMIESLPAILAFLHSPHIQRVNFSGYFPIASLDNLFENCPPTIISLGLDLRNIAHPSEVNAAHISRVQQPKVELKHLTVLNPKIMSHWLLRSTFGVSHLTSVETDARTWFKLQDSLASCLPVLQSLVLTNYTASRDLDLGKLPALRLFDVCIPPYREHHTFLVFVLLNLPPHSRLEIITIRVAIDIYEDEYSYSFDELNKDTAALVALHTSISRIDFIYNANSHIQTEKRKSFFKTDLAQG